MEMTLCRLPDLRVAEIKGTLPLSASRHTPPTKEKEEVQLEDELWDGEERDIEEEIGFCFPISERRRGGRENCHKLGSRKRIYNEGGEVLQVEGGDPRYIITTRKAIDIKYAETDVQGKEVDGWNSMCLRYGVTNQQIECIRPS